MSDNGEFETPRERDLRLARQIEEAQPVEEQSGVVRLFVCPNCAAYFGASTMGDLSTIENRDIKGNAVSTRAKCHVCGTQRIERWARLIPQSEVERVRQAVSREVQVQRERRQRAKEKT